MLSIFAEGEEYNAESVQYQVKINDEEKQFSNSIVTINDITYVPLRELFEMLGYEVQWKGKEQVIDINSYKQENGEDWLIFRENGKYGYMDQSGNIKIKAQFDLAFEFIDGIARVGNYVDKGENLSSEKNNIQYGFINANGELITPITFLYAWDFSEGLALVDDGAEDYYIDKTGTRSSQQVISSEFFTKGYAPKLLRGGSSYPMPDPPVEVWSYIDNGGNIVTDKTFEAAEKFEDNLAIVKNHDKYGLIDTEFNIVVDYHYDGLVKIDTELYAAKQGEKWGIIDLDGNIIADFDYFSIGSFSEGLAPVRREINDGGFIDRNGEILFDSGFDMVYEFVNGVACVVDSVTGKAGAIDHNGDYVIKPQFYTLRPCKDRILEAKDQSGIDYYYINLKGEKIIPH